MFLGQYCHTSDAKGRVFIPAKYRDGLGKTFIVTRGLDKCLCIYPMEEWDKLTAKIEQFPTVTGRKVKRFIYSEASDLELDTQGRALLPQTLRDYADIDKGSDVIIIGVGTYAEIWSVSEWNKEKELESSEEIAELMATLEETR